MQEKPLTEAQVREIVRSEIRNNANSGSPVIPISQNNGNDNLQINPINLVGWSPLPSSPKFYLNEDTGLYEYGFSSRQSLIPANASHTAQTIHNTTISMYPIVVVQGNGAGVQGSFNGGWAPDGTMVFFDNPSSTLCVLYIRSNGIWKGVNMGLTA